MRLLGRVANSFCFPIFNIMTPYTIWHTVKWADFATTIIYGSHYVFVREFTSLHFTCLTCAKPLSLNENAFVFYILSHFNVKWRVESINI